MIIICLLMLESPAWCAPKGKEKEAKKMLHRLHWDIKDYDVDHQYNLLLINVEHERVIAAEQSRIIGSYATYFFQQAGLKDPFKITCMTSGINIFFSIVKLRRSAAELDELFERKIKPFRFHKTTTVTPRMVDMNGEKRA
ncbi:hypothetical protein Neosp_011401 [[Neocosmospora] mangrovei]